MLIDSVKQYSINEELLILIDKFNQPMNFYGHNPLEDLTFKELDMAHPTQQQAIRGHGSPYDRGASDSYYQRPSVPHKCDAGLLANKTFNLTEEEKNEYYLGYEDNKKMGHYKEWD